MNLYVVRHGEDEDNARSLFNGRRNQKITPTGESQAKAVADYFIKHDVKLDALYTSPLDRAKKTTEIICREVKNITPIEESNLIERDVGLLSGLTVPEALKIYTGKMFHANGKQYFSEPPNGESFEDAYKRVEIFLQKLAQNHPDENICLVTHGMIVRLIYAYVYKLSIETAVGSLPVYNGDLICMSPKEPIKFLIQNPN